MNALETKRPPHWLGLARLGWVLLTAALLAVFIGGLKPRYEELVTLCTDESHCIPLSLTPTDVQALEDAGLSLEIYAGFHVGLEAFAVAMTLGLALLIFFFRPHSRLGALVCYALTLFGLNFMVEADKSLVSAYPQFIDAFDALTSLAAVPFVLLLYLFPDGRFVPSWTRWAWIGLAIAAFLDPLLRAILPIPSGQFSQVLLAAYLLALAIGIYAQIYRFRFVSTPGERQQTKWIIFGFSWMVIAIFSWSYFVEIAPPAPGPGRIGFNLWGMLAISPVFIVLPLTFVFSIFRYRLWDIDLVIRRTLSYAMLTGLLLLVYFGSIVLIQTVFRTLTGSDSQVAVVLSTLAIAALFNPLRLRVQEFIDRRFYRAKYDAEVTLGRFAVAARDEVDLDSLSVAMLGAVDETLHPERASLWLAGQDYV
jgi:hypothetical protein